MVGFSKHEFYNNLLGGITLLKFTPARVPNLRLKLNPHSPLILPVRVLIV